MLKEAVMAVALDRRLVAVMFTDVAAAMALEYARPVLNGRKEAA